MEDVKKRVIQYDVIRLIAIILVVLGHSIGLSFGLSTEYEQISLTSIKVFGYVKDIIYSFHMPLFVFLSGAIFVLTYRPNSLLKRTKNRTIKLILPYFIISLFVLIPIRYAIGYYNSNNNIGQIVLFDIFFSLDVNFLWYLIMIFAVGFIMHAIYQYIWPKKKTIKILILVLFLIISIISNLMTKPYFQINMILKYLFWYYLGMLFEEHRNNIMPNIITHRILYLCGSLIIFIVTFIGYIELRSCIENDVFGSNLVLIMKMLKMGLDYIDGFFGILMVIIICFAFNIILKHKLFINICKYSFSIYLIHCFIEWILCKLLFAIFLPSQISDLIYILYVSIRFFASLFLSLGLSLSFFFVKKKVLTNKNLNEDKSNLNNEEKSEDI